MQVITLTALSQAQHVSTSISPKASTFGEHASEPLSPDYRGSSIPGSPCGVGLSNSQRNDCFHLPSKQSI
jgi:hypothetical protein